MPAASAILRPFGAALLLAAAAMAGASAGQAQTPSQTPSRSQDAALPPADRAPTLQWVRGANGAVPLHAVAGGVEDGRTIFVCRVAGDAGTVKVGTLRTGGGCEVPMGADGTATRPRYEVLTGDPWRVSWTRSGQTLREDVLVGGAWQGQPTALCQVDHFGGVHSGMVVGDRCMVAAGGKTVMARDFRYAATNHAGQFSMRWASQGWVPQGALTASGGASGLPICLVEDQGAWWPGVLSAQGLCRSPGAGADSAVTGMAYQTVIGDPDRVVWTRFENGRQPASVPRDAVAIGGHNPAGQAATICRGPVGDDMLAGYVTDDGYCAVAGPEGGTGRLADYDVLLYRQGPAQTAGR